MMHPFVILVAEKRKGVFYVYASAYARISREALRKNAAAVIEAVDVPVIGVVKCDGYGVTLQEAAAAWQAAGIKMFGVSRPEEAFALRQLGFRQEILLLAPVAEAGLVRSLCEENVILTVSSLENARLYGAAARGTVRVHVAVDTGMGRFGLRWSDAEAIAQVYKNPGLSCEGIFSHFSSAFSQDGKTTARQLRRFLDVTEGLSRAGYPVGMRHIANSCAALKDPQTWLDGVRIGSALTGPLPVKTQIGLAPAAHFYARVVDCREFRPGETTGYGGYCVIRKPTRAAVVALGKTDGFGLTDRPDRLRTRDLAAYLGQAVRARVSPPRVFWQGQPLPLLGRIGSQYTLFDATAAQVSPGDLVQWEGNLMNSRCSRVFE